VFVSGLGEACVSFLLLKRLLGRNAPKQRIRVCSECGMPIAEHKEWCSILRGRADIKAPADRPSRQTTS
jgi:hypothetical protein